MATKGAVTVNDLPRNKKVALVVLVVMMFVLGAVLTYAFVSDAPQKCESDMFKPVLVPPTCNVLVVVQKDGNIDTSATVYTPQMPDRATLFLANTYPDNSSPIYHFNCTNPNEVNWLTVYLSKLIPYKLNSYDCTQFSRALIQNLTHYGCSARMVKGWYQGDLDNSQRNLHDWVETPNFIIEATPDYAGILNISTYGLHYDKIQTYDWNLSTLCGD